MVSLLCSNSWRFVFTLKVKIAILQYLQGLISLMDPADFVNSTGILCHIASRIVRT